MPIIKVLFGTSLLMEFCGFYLLHIIKGIFCLSLLSEELSGFYCILSRELFFL